MAGFGKFKFWLFLNLFVFFFEINVFHSLEQQQQQNAYSIAGGTNKLFANNNLTITTSALTGSTPPLARNQQRVVEQQLGDALENGGVTTNAANYYKYDINSKNSTTKPSERSVLHKVILWVIFMSIILATLIGNTLVILAVVIVRKLHTQDNANNFLIVSLAVSDLLVGVFAMPFAVYAELNNNE
jgi:hypothetical protein